MILGVDAVAMIYCVRFGDWISLAAVAASSDTQVQADGKWENELDASIDSNESKLGKNPKFDVGIPASSASKSAKRWRLWG